MVLGNETQKIADRIKEEVRANRLRENQRVILDALSDGMTHLQASRAAGISEASVSLCIKRMRHTFGVPESTHRDPMQKRLKERNQLIAAWRLFKKQNAAAQA